jgi:hypothetical protein
LGNPNITAREDLATALFYLLVGLILIAGAKTLIWLAYGDAPKPLTSGATSSDATSDGEGRP